MKTHLVFTLALLLSFTGMAQDYDYKNLQLPNVQRHILSANLGPTFTSTEGQSRWTLPLGVSASGYINNRRDQLFYSGNTNTIFSGTKIDENSKQRGIAPRFSASATYYKYNSNYFYVKPHFNTNVARSINTFSAGNAENKSLNTNSTFNTGIAVGKGRIDPIGWAIRAGFMNQSLTKAGAISRDLSETEWLELAKAMAVMDRRRFYEGRFFNINRVKRVDSLFDRFGVVVDDAAFFTTVADQYFFAPQQDLGTGSRFEVFAAYTKNNALVTQNNTSTAGTITSYELLNRGEQLRTGVSYEYARPTNLHWHHLVRTEASVNSGSSYSYEERDDVVINESDLTPSSFLSGQVSYSLNWIPSTRTWLQWTVESSTSYQNESVNADLSTSANFNYFVSRRLQYSASLIARRSLSTSENATVLFTSGFNYQIW